MHSDNVCREVLDLLNKIEDGKGTADDVERIRAILDRWDEYASWDDER